MPKRKQAPPANAEILREQIQLLQTEKDLKKTLEKVKDQINKLLVSIRNIVFQIHIIMV